MNAESHVDKSAKTEEGLDGLARVPWRGDPDTYGRRGDPRTTTNVGCRCPLSRPPHRQRTDVAKSGQTLQRAPSIAAIGRPVPA